MKDEFGDRMKMYEKLVYLEPPIHTGSLTYPAPNEYVNPNEPVFVRIDGKAFHTYVKHFRKSFTFDEYGHHVDFDETTGNILKETSPELLDAFEKYRSGNEDFEKPFDKDLSHVFQVATRRTCENIGQVMLAYGQSDEVTFLLSGWKNENSQVWFGGKVQKIVSVLSSIFTGHFNHVLNSRDYPAVFDARVWNVPEDELENVFRWRQQDARRNSVQGLAQSLFSHKELQGKPTNKLIEMCNEKGHDWNNLSNEQKWGWVVYKEKYMVKQIVTSKKLDIKQLPTVDTVERTRWSIDENIPYFIDDNTYIERRING